MPTQRLSMRRIREVLRLRHAQGLTERVIARMIGASNGVVHGYLRRALLAGLTWPLPETRQLSYLLPSAHTRSYRRKCPSTLVKIICVAFTVNQYSTPAITSGVVGS